MQFKKHNLLDNLLDKFNDNDNATDIDAEQNIFLTILEKIEELSQIVSKYSAKKVSAAKKKKLKKNETTLRTTKKTFQNEELPH